MNKEVEARLKSLQRFDPEHGSDVWFLLSLVNEYIEVLKAYRFTSCETTNGLTKYSLAAVALEFNPEEKAE